MINKHTFGKTPAAIYLASRLNILSTNKLTRKVSTMLCDLQNVINEIEKSNSHKLLSAHVIGFMLDPLRTRVKVSHSSIEKIDQLSANLMANVMCGSIKDLACRVMEARHAEQKCCKITGGKGRPFRVLEDIHREITPELLIQRSKIKLARHGKQITLY